MWVEGSRRYRAVEQQLIPAPVFAAMREAGPLPVPAPASAAEWLTDRRALLARRLSELKVTVELDALEDVRLSAGRLPLSPRNPAPPDYEARQRQGEGKSVEWRED